MSDARKRPAWLPRRRARPQRCFLTYISPMYMSILRKVACYIDRVGSTRDVRALPHRLLSDYYISARWDRLGLWIAYTDKEGARQNQKTEAGSVLLMSDLLSHHYPLQADFSSLMFIFSFATHFRSPSYDRSSFSVRSCDLAPCIFFPTYSPSRAAEIFWELVHEFDTRAYRPLVLSLPTMQLWLLEFTICKFTYRWSK